MHGIHLHDWRVSQRHMTIIGRRRSHIVKVDDGRECHLCATHVAMHFGPLESSPRACSIILTSPRSTILLRYTT